MSSPQPLFNKQSLLLSIWVASLVLSIVLYGDDLIHSWGTTSACTYTDLGKMLLAMVQPKNWLGIFTAFFVVLGVVQMARKSVSKWPLLDQYKWVALAAILFIITLAFSFGCK